MAISRVSRWIGNVSSLHPLALTIFVGLERVSKEQNNHVFAVCALPLSLRLSISTEIMNPIQKKKCFCPFGQEPGVLGTVGYTQSHSGSSK